MALTQPSLIPEPWASQGSRTTIPDTTSESGRASWAQGFPPETALPLGSGGVPPHWLDFQGVLYALSNHAIFKQSGGRYAWSASLDYPVGACIIGSNNRVYQALQNSGPGYAAGAKNPTTSGNSAYWGVLATPDGSSIVVNSGGKLAVSVTNLADQLADGTTITASGGKLTAVNQGSDASSLADNHTTIANNGKLTVDFQSLTNALRKNITPYIVKSTTQDGEVVYNGGLKPDPTTGKLSVVFADLTVDQLVPLCDPDGGIAVNSDPSDTQGYGKLMVDFSAIDDATKADIVSQLDMQVPLTGDKTIRVNASTGSDEGDDSTNFKNRDLQNPGKFKSIGAAVRFLTQKFAFGKYHGIIRVEAGTYSEDTELPYFTVTSGYIVIMADDTASPPTITNATANATPFNAIGGTWYLRHLNIVCTRSASSDGISHFCSSVESTGGSVSIQSCSITEQWSGASPGTGNHTYIRMISSYNGGQVSFSPYDATGTTLTFDVDSSTGQADSLTVLYAERQGRMSFPSTNSSTAVTSVACSGKCSTFCYASTGALVSRVTGGSNHVTFDVASGGSVSGELSYDIHTGSGVLAPIGSFPGTYSGTTQHPDGYYVDSTRACWYAI